MPTWPVTLPTLPLAQGYQESHGPNVIRTQMDAGPKKRRRRFTTTADPHVMVFEVDTDGLAAFKDFYHTLLLDGALAFDYTHPVELVTATFAFTDEPMYQNIDGPIWDITCKLERIA